MPRHSFRWALSNVQFPVLALALGACTELPATDAGPTTRDTADPVRDTAPATDSANDTPTTLTDVPVDSGPVEAWDVLSQLPPGLTLITDNRWTSLDAPGWGVYDNPTADLEIVSDPTAPDGDPSVLAQHWTGVADGYNPDYAYTGFASTPELYAAFIVRFPAEWRSEGVKWLIIEAGGSPASELPFWLGLGPYQVPIPPSGLDPVLGFTTNGGASSYPYDDSEPGWFPPTYVGPRTLTRNAWHKVQFHVSSNPDRARVWVDDTLVFDSDLEDRPGFEFTWTWGDQVFNGLQQGATWGGGNSASPPEGATIFYARTVLYGR